MAPRLEKDTTPTTTVPSSPTAQEIIDSYKNQSPQVAYTANDAKTWPYRSAIGVSGKLYEDPNTGRSVYSGYEYWSGPNVDIPAIFNQPSPRQAYQPRYFAGDDENILASMSPEQLISAQAALSAIGFLGSYRPGLLDIPTVSAFGKLLGQANLVGADWQDTAVALYTMPEVSSRSGGSTPTYKLSNPDDLKLVFNQAARNVVGRELDAATVDQLVKTFQQNEKNFYTGRGEIVEPPSPEALVQTQLETAAPGEVEAKSYGDYIGLLSQLMGGGA